jgi:cytoskeletal protein RodZ
VFEIGLSLREARTRQSLEFEEMELRTKIRAKYLRLLEEERFDQLPGHTYTKGFLRVYADALGLDGQLYVDEYNSRFVAGDEDYAPRTRRVPVARRRREPRYESRMAVVALAAIALVTALVIAAWRFGGPDEPQVQGLNATGSRGTSGQSSKAQRISVEVRAVKGPSLVEVRAGSPVGRQLYVGTLERGQMQRFVRKTVYVSVAKPRNVVVKVNGNRFPLPPSGELTLGAASSVG